MCQHARYMPLFIMFLGLQLPGCSSKVRFEKSEELDHESKAYIVAGPTKDQVVKIEVVSEAPVDVKVFLADDLDKKQYLAEKSKVQNVEFEVNIPKGKEFHVVVTTTKKCRVTTKMSSK